MRIALIGLGIVGSALHKYLVKRDHDCLRYDPPKKLHQHPDKNCKAAFIAVPVNMTKQKGEFSYVQDNSALDEAITMVPDNVPIFIRSTLFPGTTNKLQRIFPKKTIAHIPEFLTERTATRDFEESAEIIVGGDEKLGVHVPMLTDLFGEEKKIRYVPAYSAELGKHFHNYLGAVRVHVSNVFMQAAKVATKELNEEKNRLEAFTEREVYNGMKTTLLSSKNHNDLYLDVPGPDGKAGYGGKCFPKDMECMIDYFRTKGLSTELSFTEMIQSMNVAYRSSDV